MDVFSPVRSAIMGAVSIFGVQFLALRYGDFYYYSVKLD